MCSFIFESFTGYFFVLGYIYDNMRFAKQTSENLVKKAVIGKHDWESTCIGLFGGIQTADYDRSRLDAALTGLKE